MVWIWVLQKYPCPEPSKARVPVKFKPNSSQAQAKLKPSSSQAQVEFKPSAQQIGAKMNAQAISG
jgi:hypothetical protein